MNRFRAKFRGGNLHRDIDVQGSDARDAMKFALGEAATWDLEADGRYSVEVDGMLQNFFGDEVVMAVAGARGEDRLEEDLREIDLEGMVKEMFPSVSPKKGKRHHPTYEPKFDNLGPEFGGNPTWTTNPKKFAQEIRDKDLAWGWLKVQGHNVQKIVAVDYFPVLSQYQIRWMDSQGRTWFVETRSLKTTTKRNDDNDETCTKCGGWLGSVSGTCPNCSR